MKQKKKDKGAAEIERKKQEAVRLTRAAQRAQSVAAER